MASSMNRVFLMGNVTRDPELRYISNGSAVTEIGLAINDRRKSASGEWVEETKSIASYIHLQALCVPSNRA